MLSISPTQLSTFGNRVRARSSQRMEAHVERHFTRPAQLAGPACVDRLVEGCLRLADELAIRGERDLFSLLSLQLYFGTGFRNDSQCASFASILQREDVATPGARIARCWQEGKAFHRRIAGERSQFQDAAIERLAGRRLARLLADDTLLDSGQAQRLLHDIWPQKHAALIEIDPEALTALMKQVGMLARSHQVTQPGAARLLLLLTFVFGTGFADDPMFAPLGALLTSGELDRSAIDAADAFLARIAGAPG